MRAEGAFSVRDAGAAAAPVRRPRLGFLGVGWIGRNRMEAIARDGAAEIAAIADAEPAAREAACAIAPDAAGVDSLDALLDQDLDGLVIATPSALHAQQAEAALARGVAVFCQKPLARTAAETRGVIDAARRADRLLDVDLSYRRTQGMQRIRELVSTGGIGEVYAIDLVFHNAYGPDKPWFRDPVLSGGGCVIDLGIHLVDLALWTLDFPRVEAVSSRLHAGGRRLALPSGVVEDHAVAQIDLAGGCVVRLACSWNLPAGRDAVIEAAFHGTQGGAAFRNVGGSFYDFTAERFEGTRALPLAAPPDDWGGRAATHWARALARGGRYDPAIERLAEVAAVLDAIYAR
ncbi:putative dehydrogenase [Variovorax sp. TBS-050B]|uniref:Gfo/Idh/MocA family protein n=1 Tax=Variovorax sp. TBS-050B TaxID=2940551 RepID=UPI002475BFEB|nr:Gfo/Idh/MocA family oxidoreductase [Variovorax sp. TBS-050B]MDH6595009.1 putative dehydrogenase [Variovorax sp. TBS-050B]